MRTLYLDTLKSVDSQLFHYRLKVETLAKLLDQERNKSQAFQTKVEQAMKMYKQKCSCSSLIMVVYYQVIFTKCKENLGFLKKEQKIYIFENMFEMIQEI